MSDAEKKINIIEFIGKDDFTHMLFNFLHLRPNSTLLEMFESYTISLQKEILHIYAWDLSERPPYEIAFVVYTLLDRYDSDKIGDIWRRNICYYLLLKELEPILGSNYKNQFALLVNEGDV